MAGAERMFSSPAAGSLADLTALAARDRLAAGALDATGLTAACLQRCAERDGDIRAWTHLDQQLAMGQADRLDTQRRAGHPIGPLHGVPMTVKDSFMTEGCITTSRPRVISDR